ncbi:mucin-2 isoform X2 [Uranotaenia lowii]|uniref:mucin-2 isoform X2 n=1 Tax=Uranotaenia lowii TaxID=190385 RepID=UPI00247A8461|nr:mucin-2 isoform X2 [Uranotaenia lowii]
MAIDIAKRLVWYPVIALLLNLSCLHAGERWSRQLTEFGSLQGSDWIPLSPQIRSDRQSGAKVLNFFNDAFLGTDNHAQPQHQHFTFVNQPFQGQASRLVFPPPPVAQPLQQDLDSTFNQPFGGPSFLPQPTFGGLQNVQRHPLPPYSPQHQPQPTQANNLRAGTHQPAGVSQEEVQLLYVPVETLYNQKQQQQNKQSDISRFNALPQPVSPSLINDFYTLTTTTSKPRTTNNPYPTIKPTQAQVTQPPTKLKPNQPPLAMFMYNEDRIKITTAEALGTLKNVNEIAVLDSLSKNLPKVFIGPSGLAPPKGYSKFELPYLSNIEHNRFDRKLPDDLPFFVAPLSYKTPNGFSKIALPAPHVGSVIVQQTQASSQPANYFRQPPQDNIEYYQPATLKFPETTKPPVNIDHFLPSTKSTSPDRSSYSRGNTQAPQDNYRQTHSPFGNSVNSLPNRHIVNEEYFNLAKTKKPTAPPTAAPPPPPPPPQKIYKQFDFKPIPEQKIPLYNENEDQQTVFTTARPTTSERTTIKSFFREENFRNRRPTTVFPPYEDDEPVRNQNNNNHEEERFVHKFKLVDSVRPQTTPATKSIIDNAFLEFFQNDNLHDMVKTVVSKNSQNVRNNFYSSNGAPSNNEPPKQNFVSTYYAPTTTAPTTIRTTQPPTTVPPTKAVTTEDNFFKEFDERSKLYETGPPAFVQQTRTNINNLHTQEPFLNRFTETSYINKYKYETNTNHEPHYPVEVVTTQDPLRHETPADVEIRQTTQTQDRSTYSAPSELPPISANLPGLVNSLMEDEWPYIKKGQDQGNSAPATAPAKGHFRKQPTRTTTSTTTPAPETYATEVTTRRSRGRRPTSAPGDSSAGTRSSVVNRSRSRYVPSADERPSSRTRSRSRVQTNPRVVKEEENIDYQRDVLKQNYPAIRPLSSSTSTTTPAPPTTTTTTTTTQATTIPVTYHQIYEEQTERIDPYSPSYEDDHIVEIPKVVDEVSIPQREVYTNENYYNTESTSSLPPTTRQDVSYATQQEEDDESVRVLPVNHPVEQQRRERPVEIPRRQPVHRQQEELPQVPATYFPEEDQQPEQPTPKVEVTPRPRRPLSRQQVYSPRTTTQSSVTERATATTTEYPSRVVSHRRPASASFVRRPSRPLYTTTTTAAPPTTTYSSRNGGYSNGDDESVTQAVATVRPKSRSDILRARARRPVTTTATTPTTASPEPPVTRGFARTKDLRRVSPTIRSRQEPRQQKKEQQDQDYDTTTTQQTPRFRIRERTRFNLQPQESQWSTKLTQNSFQPVQNVESRHKNYEVESEQYNNEEPEIVTASSQQQEDESGLHLINVSAKLGGSSKVVANEVTLRQGPPQVEDPELQSNVPSFAELLDDVMSGYIHEHIDHAEQSEENTSTAVDNEVLLDADNRKPVAEAQRNPLPIGQRNSHLFRKRGRSHNTAEAFETAETQHVNSQLLNAAAEFEALKNIDKANLQGKNLPEEQEVIKATSIPVVEDEKVPEEHTDSPTSEVSETEAITVPEVTTVTPETTPAPLEITSILPVERETTTPFPTLEVTNEEDDPSTEQNYDEEEPAEGDQPEDPNQGIFADVKKQISDLFAMAENDPMETEEVLDEADDHRPLMAATYQITTEPPVATTTTTTEVNEVPTVTESLADSAAASSANSPMPIPTSTSNGITHDTEICYRGRCVKTDQKKAKLPKFTNKFNKPN